MKESLKLKEERQSLIDELQNIVNNSKEEKRSFTEDETKRQDEIHAEIARLDGEISRAEKNEEILSRSAGPVNKQSKEEKEIQSRFSISRAIGLVMRGKDLDGVEKEVFQEAVNEARDAGVNIEGNIAIPSSFMEKRDYNATTGSAGGFTVGTEIGEAIEILRPVSVIESAGARVMTGLTSNVSFPRQTATVTADYLAETEESPEGTSTMDQLNLTPKRVGAWSEYSKRLFTQSSLSVDNFITNDLMLAIGTEVDRVSINGSGADNEPTGVLNTPGIGSVAGGTNGAVPNWSNVVDLETAVNTANALLGNLNYVMTPGLMGVLKKVAKDAGSGIFLLEDGQLNGFNAIASGNVPSNLTKGTANAICHALIFGNWDDLLIGYFGGLDITVDPYSSAKKGQVIITADTHMDVGVRRGASFSAMVDALLS